MLATVAPLGEARPGKGTVAVAQSATGRVAITTLRAESPLRLLAPKNHGDAAWVFTSTFGGGLVQGDRIELTASVGPASALLLGTQASTKVYAGAQPNAQTLTVRVASGGLAVLLADPTVCFAGARFSQTTTVELAEDASLVVVEAFTAGRVAYGERWAFARYASRIRVSSTGRIVLHESVVLDRDTGLAAPSRFDAHATVIAVGPRALPITEEILASAAVLPDAAVAPSPLGRAPGPAAIARIAARSTEPLKREVRRLLACLPDVLGDDPFARKW